MQNPTSAALRSLAEPCNWSNLTATFSKETRELCVAIKLAPVGAEDALLVPPLPEAVEALPPAPRGNGHHPANGTVVHGDGSSSDAASHSGQFGRGSSGAVNSDAAEAETRSVSSDASFGSAKDELEEQLPPLPADEDQNSIAIPVAVQPPAAEPPLPAPEVPCDAEPDTSARGPGAAPAPATPPAQELPELGTLGQDTSSEGAGEPAAAAKKKRKKKKKKKGQQGAGEAAAQEEGAGEEGEQREQPTGGEQEAEQAVACLVAGLVAAEGEAEIAALEQPNEGATAEEFKSEPESPVAAEPAVPGLTELGVQVEHRQFSGPFISHALSKDRNKVRATSG